MTRKAAGVPPLVAAIRDAVGAGTASCRTCAHMTYESDGDYGQYNWHECRKRRGVCGLRSFPFRKEQACWEPVFWCSRFAPHENGPVQTNEEYETAWRLYQEAVAKVMEEHGRQADG